MAEDQQDDLELKTADAGTAFRAEMFATQILLGYWKHALAAVIIALILILGWGQYRDMHRRSQRSTTARIAETMSKLPEPLPALAESVASGEEVDAAKIEAVGDELVGLADGSSGTASVEARITAAEAFRLAGKPDKQRAALENASGASGVLAYAVESELANLDLEQGLGDSAVARLEKLSTSQSGFLAEQAAIDLGLAYEHLGRGADAAKVYASFMERFPNSPRIEGVRVRQQRVAAQ
ncbi:MAG: tetratricopeptide repeat protein [Alphaproteobacteria bacterium]|nr:tetratricopeptide repeat protein [Alphaproteobacteria bacterium]